MGESVRPGKGVLGSVIDRLSRVKIVFGTAIKRVSVMIGLRQDSFEAEENEQTYNAVAKSG